MVPLHSSLSNEISRLYHLTPIRYHYNHGSPNNTRKCVMAKELSFTKQTEIIQIALEKKFPGVEFVLGRGLESEDDSSWTRYISVNFRDQEGITKEEVSTFLERFRHDPPNEHKVSYLRTFWINPKGDITIARIRALYEDGTTSLVEKFESPGPDYTLERFSIQHYRVNKRIKGFRYFDY